MSKIKRLTNSEDDQTASEGVRIESARHAILQVIYRQFLDPISDNKIYLFKFHEHFRNWLRFILVITVKCNNFHYYYGRIKNLYGFKPKTPCNWW